MNKPPSADLSVSPLPPDLSETARNVPFAKRAERAIDVLATRATVAVRALPRQIASHWPWLLVALAYLLAWWIPFEWSKEIWLSPHHVEIFQPWLPLCSLFLIYTRRTQLKDVWARAQRKSRSKRPSTWERGNASVVSLGCLLLLGLHLIQVKGLSVLALVVIAIGVVYQVYGWRVVRAVAGPLLLLFLMIPLPDSPLVQVNRQASAVTFQLLAKVLTLLHHPVAVDGTKLNFLSNNFTVDFGTINMGHDYYAAPIGTDIAVGAALAMLVYGLYKQYGSVRIVGGMLTGSAVALCINFIRMLLVALLAERSPSIAERLKDYNVLLVVLVSSFIAALLAHAINQVWLRVFESVPGSSRRRSPFQIFLQRLGYVVSLPFLPIVFLLGFVTRAGNGVGHAARRSEMRTERVLHSVSPLSRVFLIPVTLLRRSERGIESLFRRLTKKKRGRGSRSRH